MAKLCLAAVCAGGKSFGCKTDGGGYDAGKSCDDGNSCTDGDVCDVGVCKPGPAKACDDKNPCTTDTCDAKLGCQFANNTASCDDGNKCTEVDSCSGGGCFGKAKNCDDAKTCTADSCKDGACANLPQAGTCTDGNQCTDGDLCTTGACAPGKVVNCDDSNPCTTDSCDPAKGCVWVVKDGACDDGNNCTTSDTCTAGKCTGVGKQCDDTNPCTDDKCDGGVCSFVSNSKPCDDKDACTDNDTCSQAKCVGKAKSCDDGNPCTDNACLSTGCAFVANTASCDDGDGCTDKDVCFSGKCAGSAKTCDDGNPCTDDSCAANKCANVANTKGCGTAGSCDICAGGKCVPDASKGFEDTYGGTSTDHFRGALPISGGWLLFGTTSSKGLGGEDGYVVRIDATGSVLWEKTYGTNGNDSLRAGVVTPDGNFAMTGYVYNSTYSTQAWLLKIDDTGKVLLEKNIGAGNLEYGWGIAASGTNFLIAGEYKYTSSSTTYEQGRVWQLDKDGAVAWEAQLTSVTYAEAVAPSADGNVYVVASGSGPGNSTDILVKKLKPGGSQLWSTAVGTNNGSDYPGDMIVGSDGNLYVSGRQYLSGGDRLVMAKLDATGAISWTKTYGDSYTESYGMAELGDGVVAVGRVYQNSQYDGYLVRAAKVDGAMTWDQKAPFGTYTDELYGVTAASNGLIAVGSAYAGSSTGYDAWVLRLNDKGAIACVCTGTTCDDGNGCTADTCVLGVCKGKQVASGTYCKETAIPTGKCDAAGKCITLCGNKYCDSGENNLNCAVDCTTKCGNGVCEAGESFANCSSDCKHICDSYCTKAVGSPAKCYCDSICKEKGDCCDPTGSFTVGKTCAGSTCGACN